MSKNIYILTGPVSTGKTTRLLDWSLKTNEVFGIASPVIRNRRMFFDLSTRAVFSMEAEDGNSPILKIGKYNFSMAAFINAEKIISEGMKNNTGYLVMDEIGPLEIQGKGFGNILKKILSIQERNYHLVLVIRDKILEDALKHFGIEKYIEFNFE